MDSQLSWIVPGLVLPPISTKPVPFGVAVIFPFAPSVIVIVPELVPEFVSKIKSFRKIEPYKGKGVREKGQYILKKEGKKK